MQDHDIAIYKNWEKPKVTEIRERIISCLPSKTQYCKDVSSPQTAPKLMSSGFWFCFRHLTSYSQWIRKCKVPRVAECSWRRKREDLLYQLLRATPKPQWLKVEPEGGNESPEKAWAEMETDLCPGGTEKQGMTKWWLVIVTHQKELNLSSASHS